MERNNYLVGFVAWCAVTLLITGTGGLSASAQNGWRISPRGEASGKDLNTVYFLDAKRGWVGGDNGLVLSTSDAGQHWQVQSVSGGSAVNDIYFRDKENGYLLTGNRIFQSRDSGQSWREAHLFDQSRFGGMPELYSVRFAGKNKGWIVGSISKGEAVVDSLVLRTDDGGVSWRRTIAPTHGELIHLDFANDHRGWIVGADGTILSTSDEGESWIIQRSGTKSDLYHVDFRNEDRGWAVGQKGTILRTVDGGATWMQALISFRNTLLSIQFVDDKRGWLVGRGGLIMRSEDGGITWMQQASGTTQNIYSLFVENKNAWAVGGDGAVLQFAR
jgi:photosystem II stability/assembly factor-like uncharacterized protein